MIGDNRFYRQASDEAEQRATIQYEERSRIVKWLRRGGEYSSVGNWWPWDSEMKAYYAAAADRIEEGDYID